MNNPAVRVKVGAFEIGGGAPLALIAGPCVIESADIVFHTARFLKDITDRLNIPFIFKSSFDKANRTSISSFRGPGPQEGLAILADIRSRVGVPVISDIHALRQIQAAQEVLDIIQIPAFLCRQTDLIVAAAATGKPVNIKKGQFLAPADMANVTAKAAAGGNRNILITERGTCFGYNNLVVDFRGISIMQRTGFPVVFDATHSIQLPGGAGGASSGEREFAPVLAKAAVAAGADAVFMEVHPDPDRALCDGPNTLKLDDVEALLKDLLAIRRVVAPAMGTESGPS